MLMKKFTIIAAPEYEHLFLEEFSKARVVQLKEVTGLEFERLKEGERTADFKALYEKYHETYQRLVDIGLPEQETADLSTVELQNFFINDPEETVEDFLETLKEFMERAKEAKVEQDTIQKQREQRLIEARARLEGLKALQPEELRRCIAVGLTKLSVVERLAEHLQRFDDTSYKVVETSSDKGYIFVSGPEEREKWVETLFLIFEVKDVFEVLSTRDVLLALDAGIREQVIKEYEEEVAELQLLVKEEDGLKERIDEIERRTISENEELYSPLLSKAKFLDYMLGIMSNEKVPVVRTRLISLIQGWVPEDKVQILDEIKADLEERTGELFFIQYEEPRHDEHTIPSPEPEFKPSILQPAWKLTTLRGWPSAHEVNPSYISIIIFSFQFGLMYGDIGQGAVFLLVGLYLSRKYKRGMMSRLSGLFIPMGIAAIIFGFLYDSIFLVEGLLFHHHQLMPNPVHETTKLMLLIFQIAAIEVIIGLVLGAVNQIKAGNWVGALGEHGLGMILYVGGLYLTAVHFINIGMDFMGALGNWTFYLALAGMFLSFLEPILHSVTSGHGVGMESIGEGVGGLLMTFVEGLANLFSFLRIAAFALAHASLAIAAEALTHSLGIAGIGLVVMNVIALSFEFVSSSVQSLRLLYYEFMGKFFHGDGVPFRPYRLRTRKS
jgi:vacuolar-type H+-ATPase subunit I/STV1